MISVIEPHPAGADLIAQVEALFSPEGLLAQAKNFEYRPQQQEMAVAVARALVSREHLVVSNYKRIPDNVRVEVEGKPLDTGLRKFGALVGDGAEIGCNAVLNPGSIVGRNSIICASVNWRGVLESNRIAKNKAAVEVEARCQKKNRKSIDI